MPDIYQDMVQPRGAGYRSDQIKPYSHYREPIDQTDGRLHGESRRWGDATPEVQSRVIDTLIESSRDAGLSPRETAHVLAIARVESGFNPDAAAGTTSASGLGQFIDGTGSAYGLGNRNRFDVEAQSDALVKHFIDNRELAQRRGQGEEYIYKYHHDGPTRDYGGLGLAERKVLPHLDEYTRFVNERLAQSQGQTQEPAQTQSQGQAQSTVGAAAAVGAAAGAGVAALHQAQSQSQSQSQAQPASQQSASSFQHTMQVMLPPQNGVKPHITGHYGEERGHKDHGGTDFNYVGGQAGRNLQHPTINAPISGKVTFAGGTYGTVKIQDAQGNSHEILHMQGVQVKEGQQIQAGQPIGTMGGRGPNGADQYAQHVHYQLRDPSGKLQSPEAFWDQRRVQDAPAGQARGEEASSVLRHGARGEDVTRLQKELNQAGVRDAHGKPLAEDGRFGDNTREALTAYQRAQGLKADGVAGPQTLGRLAEPKPAADSHSHAAPARGPQLGEPGHRDTPLHAAIRAQLPSAVSNDMAAHVTRTAKEAGIDSPEKLQSVAVQDGKAFVMGTTPGFRAMVDMSQPAPPAEQTSAALQGEKLSAQVQQGQEEQQRAAVAMR
ncbi:peptidoglycan-binding protein [Stenotrophomonas sp. CFBP 13725]|uniref:peptidoglycan-binding protein n=1 Tax=Stenotrophomonas sp. CFBP 13725 TaxID=2775297 RepID=UPI00177D463D|nr:peptidoglycan-binding protein [Stenotrophomonas sp. CFBP 13725]MBD8637327.1 peptidoglycan DD-metalloendopeptidase family protein [Stenotrophomonas sp. CFBP 13725]